MANAQNASGAPPAGTKNTLVADSTVFKFAGIFIAALVLFFAIKLLLGVREWGSGSGSNTGANEPQSTCMGGTFQINAGEERQTVMGADLERGLGCMYEIGFTGPYLILAPAGNGRYNEYRNMSGWCGLPPGGLVRIRGLRDNTTVTFRFVGLLRDPSRCFRP